MKVLFILATLLFGTMLYAGERYNCTVSGAAFDEGGGESFIVLKNFVLEVEGESGVALLDGKRKVTKIATEKELKAASPFAHAWNISLNKNKSYQPEGIHITVHGPFINAALCSGYADERSELVGCASPGLTAFCEKK